MRWILLCCILGCATVKPDLLWREESMEQVIEIEADAKVLFNALTIIAARISDSDKAIIKRHLDWYAAHYIALLAAIANADRPETILHLREGRNRLNSAAKIMRVYAS